MNTFTLTPLQRACPRTQRLPLHRRCSIFRPRPSLRQIQPEAPGRRHLDGGRRRSTPAPSSDDDDALITVTYLGSRRLSGPASHGRGDRCVDAIVRSPPPPFRNERKLRWNFPGNNCEG